MKRAAAPGEFSRAEKEMVAAVVSGVAALVATQHPEWTPAQVRQALRWSTGDIDEKNPDARRQYGSGIVDAVGATGNVPLPGIHVTALELMEEQGDGVLEQAETAMVRVTLRNELSEARDLIVRLVSADPDLVLLEEHSRNKDDAQQQRTAEEQLVQLHPMPCRTGRRARAQAPSATLRVPRRWAPSWRRPRNIPNQSVAQYPQYVIIHTALTWACSFPARLRFLI